MDILNMMGMIFDEMTIFIDYFIDFFSKLFDLAKSFLDSGNIGIAVLIAFLILKLIHNLK